MHTSNNSNPSDAFPTVPQLIDGGIAVDDRGSVSFVNGFAFTGVKRFYIVRNHRAGFIRAFHAHKKEGKYVMLISGSAKVCVYPVANWTTGEHSDKMSQFILSSLQPKVLWIPPGYANGFQTLTDDAVLIFYSTSTLEESKGDDFRFHWNTINCWQEDFR